MKHVKTHKDITIKEINDLIDRLHNAEIEAARGKNLRRIVDKNFAIIFTSKNGTVDEHVRQFRGDVLKNEMCIPSAK